MVFYCGCICNSFLSWDFIKIEVLWGFQIGKVIMQASILYYCSISFKVNEKLGKCIDGGAIRFSNSEEVKTAGIFTGIQQQYGESC